MATAKEEIGSTAWFDDAQNDRFHAGQNKCNLFVYDVPTAAGVSLGTPNGRVPLLGYPPTATQWADPDYEIPNWVVLPPGEPPLPGDVVAQRIPYTDASGHVMIVGPDGTFIGTGDAGTEKPHGTIVQKENLTTLGPQNKIDQSGPLVYRRYVS